jgi:hypothetical protein
MKRPDEPRDPNQGEGDRASARVYNDNVREFISRGKVDRAASDARDYVEHEPEDAARAESQARRRSRLNRGSVRHVDDLVAMGRTVMDRVRRGIAVLRERYHHRK